MINDQEAADYAQQMHPAFAGYLFDGKVSTYDALAVIFHLLKKGVLEPEFKDKHILHGIEYIRLMHQKPEFEFEQIICNTMFQNSTRLSAKEIGEYIKSNTIQDII